MRRSDAARVASWIKGDEAQKVDGRSSELTNELREHLAVIEQKIDELDAKVGKWDATERRAASAQSADVFVDRGDLGYTLFSHPHDQQRPESREAWVSKKPSGGTPTARPPSAPAGVRGWAKSFMAGSPAPPAVTPPRTPKEIQDLAPRQSPKEPPSPKQLAAKGPWYISEDEPAAAASLSEEESEDAVESAKIRPASTFEVPKPSVPSPELRVDEWRPSSVQNDSRPQSWRRSDRRTGTEPGGTMQVIKRAKARYSTMPARFMMRSTTNSDRRTSELSNHSRSTGHKKVGRLRSFLQLPVETKPSGLKGAVRAKLGLQKTMAFGGPDGSSESLALEKARSTWLWGIVHGIQFQSVVSAMIVLNVALVGVFADIHLKMEVQGKPENPAFEHVERSFTVFFTFELLLRIISEQSLFLWGPEWKWNLFDSILVVLSLLDGMVISALNVESVEGLGNVNAGRILRFVRFIRVIRIARAVRAFHSLRIVVYAIFESMVSLVWCFLVVFLIIYVFSIIFLYGVTEQIRSDRPSNDEMAVLLGLYGSVPRASTTLFMTISGGIDWRDAVSPLRSLSWMFEPLFNFYVFFMVIGVLNVVVGAFVAATAEISSRDRDYLVKNEMTQMDAYGKKVKTFFKEADKDHSGQLSWEEFKDYLKIPKVSAYFRSLELDVSQAHLVFKLLDGDGSNEVNLEEFLQGCMRLRGPARSLDMNVLLYENKRLHSKMESFMKMVSTQLQRPKAEKAEPEEEFRPSIGQQMMEAEHSASEASEWA